MPDWDDVEGPGAESQHPGEGAQGRNQVGFRGPNEGDTIEVAQEVWERTGVKPDLAKPAAPEQAPRPMIHTENVPAELRPDVDALVER